MRPMRPTPRYPWIKVKLVGTNGNAFAVIGKVRQALWEACIPNPTITEFICQATRGDYHHLLRTCMEWVEVE